MVGVPVVEWKLKVNCRCFLLIAVGSYQITGVLARTPIRSMNRLTVRKLAALTNPTAKSNSIAIGGSNE
jgi:hypothetical protein